MKRVYYVKERLLPGAYEVKIELSGFKQAVYPNVRVERRHADELDFSSQVGAVSESVEVTGFARC